ncbi:MAG: sensor hybrid histidine kinase [Rhizobium sp.]|nr:sensor hybrid histidine kinase [Rhizobium sp.]
MAVEKVDPPVSPEEAAAKSNELVKDAVRPVVLLVEDEALIRMVVVEMIEELGYTALEAASGEEALNILEHNGAVDVMVSDLGLPGLSGEQLALQVRSRWPQIAIVFATGSNEAPSLDDPTRTAMLGKPFNEDALGKVLSNLLG